MSSAEPVVNALSNVLADTHTLYLKTHNFDWNGADRHGYPQIRRYLAFDCVNRYFRRKAAPAPR